MLQQLRDPHAVPHIGLPPWHLRDLRGIGEHTRERIFEHVVDRLPVHAVPPGRRMFEVTAEETIALAGPEGLRATVRLERQPDSFGHPEITWTRLVFSS